MLSKLYPVKWEKSLNEKSLQSKRIKISLLEIYTWPATYFQFYPSLHLPT